LKSEPGPPATEGRLSTHRRPWMGRRCTKNRHLSDCAFLVQNLGAKDIDDLRLRTDLNRRPERHRSGGCAAETWAGQSVSGSGSSRVTISTSPAASWATNRPSRASVGLGSARHFAENLARAGRERLPDLGGNALPVGRYPRIAEDHGFFCTKIPLQRGQAYQDANLVRFSHLSRLPRLAALPA
jgi:hypothetical protein